MPNIERLRRIREIAERLPQNNADRNGPKYLGWATMQELLGKLRESPGTKPDMFNMGAIYAWREDNCGTVACLAGITIHEFQDEARQIANAARDARSSQGNTTDVAGIILGLDHETTQALFLGWGTTWSYRLREMPKATALRGLDQVINGSTGYAIWDGTSDQRNEA